MKLNRYTFLLLVLYSISCKHARMYEVNDPNNVRAKALSCSLKKSVYIDSPNPLYLVTSSGYVGFNDIGIGTNQSGIGIKFYFSSVAYDIPSGTYNIEYNNTKNSINVVKTDGVLIMIGDVFNPDENTYKAVKGQINVVKKGNNSYLITFCEVEFMNVEGSRYTLFKGYGNIEF